MRHLRWLYVYWSVVMAGLTVIIASFFDPIRAEELLPFSLSGGRLVTMVASPPFLVCLAATALAIGFARRHWARAGGLSATDKMVVLWFVMNATWFHVGCDAFSGLFQVMPNLTEAYRVMNPNHWQPMHHVDRVALDMVYWFELLVQMPLCWLAAWMCLKRAPGRHIVIAFLSGLHLTGTVAYYAPNALLGHTFHPLMSNLDRAFGVLWIIIPTALTIRAIRQLDESQPVAVPAATPLGIDEGEAALPAPVPSGSP
ncbi:MAG: hypothetical protein JRI68_26535 [Deltaproteobacteria bacterium]|nr:hypothetical protein [Deltaproteobacteria bacterium]